ncbi:hypothetical protein HMPREF3212_00828 [Citrobacter freundii]|nr:hypothetical protein HMPREF3212_00828 [Citrobacter freundii]
MHTVWLRQLLLQFAINWPARSSLMISVITPNIGKGTLLDMIQ